MRQQLHNLLRGSTLPLHDHDMYIYDSQEREVTHALQFLKKGLKNNERCLLIANHSAGKKPKGRRNNQWESSIKTLEESDVKVISASDWFLRGHTASGINIGNIVRSWADLSSKRALRGRTKLRAFIDMSPVFTHELLGDLVELESRLATIQGLPLKLICAYLESDLSLLLDLSLLSSGSYEKIRGYHRHVYHFRADRIKSQNE